jgi:predicted nucleic acid-binding protein
MSPEMAIEAGRIRAHRYHREHAAISLADCMAAAAALAARQPLATADPALAKVVRAEGGDIHPLPGSKGRRP